MHLCTPISDHQEPVMCTVLLSGNGLRGLCLLRCTVSDLLQKEEVAVAGCSPDSQALLRSQRHTRPSWDKENATCGAERAGHVGQQPRDASKWQSGELKFSEVHFIPRKQNTLD